MSVWSATTWRSFGVHYKSTAINTKAAPGSRTPDAPRFDHLASVAKVTAVN